MMGTGQGPDGGASAGACCCGAEAGRGMVKQDRKPASGPGWPAFSVEVDGDSGGIA